MILKIIEIYHSKLYDTPTGISVINSSSGTTIDINLSQNSPQYFTNNKDIIRLSGVVSGSIFQ